MTIRAVVFDLDGTLTEFNLDYKTVRAEVMNFLIKRGIPASLLSLKESIFKMLEKAEVYLRNTGEEHLFSGIRERAVSIAGKYEIKAAHDTSLLPGVIETLKALKSMKLKLAIFTINGGEATQYILRSLHLKRFFDSVVAREDASNVKPDPSHLITALKGLGVEAGEAIVVGDNAVDMRSARALNVTAVGLATSDDDVDKLNYEGATHIVNSITDLPRLIAGLNENNS